MPITTANVTTAGNVVYTSTGNTAITFLSICNYGASTVLANVYAVPNGDTVGNTNIIVSSIELTAAANTTGDTYQLYSGGEKLLLGNGDTIVIDTTANTVTSVTSYTTI